MRRRWWAVALMTVALVSVLGCSGGGHETATRATLGANLRGEQAVPPVNIAAQGTGTVRLLDTDVLDVTVSTQGLTGVQRVTIERGAPGVAGPVLFTLFTTAGGGTWSGSVSRRLTAADVQTGSFADAVTALVQGQAYFQVTTTNMPTGALRGQIGPVQLQSALSGQNVVPPVSTVSSGVAGALINAEQTQIALNLSTVGLGHVNAIEIRLGAPGQEGPLLFALFPDGSFNGSLVRTLTARDLTLQPEQDILSFGDAVSAMIAGDTYITIRTQAFPAGELRGQLLPIAQG